MIFPSLMQVFGKTVWFLTNYDLVGKRGLIYEPLNITYGALIDKLRARSRNIIVPFD